MNILDPVMLKLVVKASFNLPIDTKNTDEGKYLSSYYPLHEIHMSFSYSPEKIMY